MARKTLFLAASLLLLCLSCADKSAQAENNNIFVIQNPDYHLSPLTGMTRKHWVDAARYLLEGAFSYIHTLDDPMKFPKQEGVSYPRTEEQVPTEKLEGLCRTLFVAMPLLREDPDLTLNNIRVADYYRYQLLQLIDPESPSYIRPRPADGGPSQNLVEFGALAISLFGIPDILWHPLSQEQKNALAHVMLSYGDGPTVPSNWKFFNIFVLSFFKEQGYAVNEPLLEEYLEKSLEHYRGEGWYNDNPAYDYYSMWAFQMYGITWNRFFGNTHYPEYARRFDNNFREMVDNYPYLFNRNGEMVMWGRSICYRFGAIVPFPLTGYLNDPEINYGWMRRIASSTLLQFLTHPEFLADRVPTLGFYGPFEPAVQGYSCRGSVYWSGKAFLGLLLPEDNSFWSATENEGPWENELQKGNVYNRFQPGSDILITDYPNSGASEIRAWCHVSWHKSWEKFRASENYNRLAYNSEFPWMADGENGEVAMNYTVKNGEGAWEVLRLYTFRKFEDGVYYREAVLETNEAIRFSLADIPLPDGILRVDRITAPVATDIRLGHYALPETGAPIRQLAIETEKGIAATISNEAYHQAMVCLSGWDGMEVVQPEGLHPASNRCAVINATGTLENEKIYITLQLWKKGPETFTEQECLPVKDFRISDDNTGVELIFADGSVKRVNF